MEKQVITETLLEFGMPINLNGFQYIIDALMLLDRPEWSHPKWTALYNCIGNIYGISGSLVEASIRNILKVTKNRNSDYEKIQYYIGFDNCENSNSILKLYNRIKLKHRTEKQLNKEYLIDLINAM